MSPAVVPAPQVQGTPRHPVIYRFHGPGFPSELQQTAAIRNSLHFCEDWLSQHGYAQPGPFLARLFAEHQVPGPLFSVPPPQWLVDDIQRGYGPYYILVDKKALGHLGKNQGFAFFYIFEAMLGVPILMCEPGREGGGRITRILPSKMFRQPAPEDDLRELTDYLHAVRNDWHAVHPFPAVDFTRWA